MEKIYNIYWMVNDYTSHKLFTGTQEECEIELCRLLKSELAHVFGDDLVILEEVK